MTERTLILIKPDGVKNGHVGDIIARIERKGLKFVAMDLRVADRATAEKHYAEHVDKPFFGELVDFITSAPLVAGVIEGLRAIDAVDARMQAIRHALLTGDRQALIRLLQEGADWRRTWQRHG